MQKMGLQKKTEVLESSWRKPGLMKKTGVHKENQSSYRKLKQVQKIAVLKNM